MDSMSIGKVANRVAVGVETLRFYEREGLLEKPPRLNSGSRVYPAATVNRVLHQARQRTRVFAQGDQRAAGPAFRAWRNLRACQEARRSEDRRYRGQD